MAEASDLITLRGLSAVGNHGVYDFERSGAQVFTADLTLHVDSRKAAQTDDVKHTVDYAKIADEAVGILTGKPVYLLETLAYHLAEMALGNPQVSSVDVTVHKPMAPVRHQFSDVSVTITRDRGTAPVRVPSQPQHAVKTDVSAPPSSAKAAKSAAEVSRVVLALGSNLGDSAAILSRAVAALMEVRGLEIDDVSPLVRTKPVLATGQDAQPDYQNAVVVARTVLSPTDLLAALQSIELQFGRTREERWSARTLDIDIIDFGGRVENLPGLDLPHPRAQGRAFVLYPWSLIAPDDTLPSGRRVLDLAGRAPDRSGIIETRVNWLEEPTAEVEIEASGAPAVLRMPPPPDSPVRSQAPAVLAAPAVKPVPPVPTRVAPSRVKPAEEAPRSGQPITIRGNKVTLRPVGEDTLFQRLLQSEGAHEAAEPAPKPAPAPLPRRMVPPKPEPVVQEPVVEPQEESQPQPASIPPEPPRVQEPERRQSEGLRLPDWRPVRSGKSVRIVDAVEVSDVPDDPAWTQTPTQGVSRRRVVRPTPTGMIPLEPPETYEDNQ